MGSLRTSLLVCNRWNPDSIAQEISARLSARAIPRPRQARLTPVMSCEATVGLARVKESLA